LSKQRDALEKGTEVPKQDVADGSPQPGSRAPSGAGQPDLVTAFPIIHTKIQTPRRRSDLLLRSRLVNQVHALLDRKLIILSAPAGYGKTSLLVDFAESTDFPVCWLTLDSFDRDFRLFLEYFISAIAVRFPTFGAESRRFLRQAGDPAASLYAIVAVLVQEVQACIPEYFILVLDDYHSVDEQDTIAEFLDLFVTYVDENCHLIVASRNLLALPNMALLIARRQAAGLSIDELRFTPREIQSLVQQNFALELKPSQADYLVQRTGGWITGILLSSVSAWKLGKADTQTRGRISQELYDYLLTQLLEKQPPALREFLLVSSVLEEISPALCTQVLEIQNSSELFSQVRQRSLFSTEFAGADELLRYHDLIRDFLRASLQRLYPERYHALMLQAASHYAGRQEWGRALERYFKLGEARLAVDLLEKIASVYFDNGRWDSLAGWIDALPGDVLADRSFLLVQRAKIYTERGQHARALELFDQAERSLETINSDPSAEQARILVLKASMLRLQDRYMECVAHCQQALLLATGNTPELKYTRAIAQKNIGLCWIWLGRMDDGRSALRQAMQLFQELAGIQDIAMIQHDMGLVHELAGDLSGASDYYRLALQSWQELGNLSPWANELNSLGVVYHMQGELEQAVACFEDALLKARQSGDLRIQAFILASQGDLRRDQGDYTAAESAYQEALETAHRANSGMIITYALDGLGNLARLRDDFIQARYRLQDAWEYAEEHTSAYELSLCQLSQGILANETGNLGEARLHLDSAVQTCEKAGLKQQLGRAYFNLAQTCFLSGDSRQAWRCLEQAFELAGRLGYDQFLVCDSTRLRSLLQSATALGVCRQEASKLLAKSKAQAPQTGESHLMVETVSDQPEIQIRAFGQPEVILDGKPVQWAVVKSRDLFFLLLQYPQGLSREQIGAIFWPDHTPERLEPAFRSTLYRLRRAVSRDCVLFQDGLYRFNGSIPVFCDVREFEYLLDQAETAASIEKAVTCLETARQLYRGDYLQDSYEDWCGLERERLRNRILAATEKLAALYTARGKLSPALALYQRLVKDDPYHEDAQRELIRLQYLLGDRAAAIRQYQALVKLLQEELGLRPHPETEALYQRIISGELDAV
jgi:LuxR family transcriptional regulator, maltose regulon positive regulatory protein